MADNQKPGSPEEIDKDLKEILLFLAGFVKTLIERLKDGFQVLPDTIAMIPALLPGQQAYEGNENAWKYLASLTDEKINETVDLILKEIGNISPTLKEMIKRGLLFAAQGYMLFLAGKAHSEANKGKGTGAKPA